MIGTSAAMALFIKQYGIIGSNIGQPLGGALPNAVFFGGFAGTFTVIRQRSDGIVFCALFNQARDAVDTTGMTYSQIQQLLDEATSAIPSWP